MIKQIPNQSLRLSDIPLPDADLSEIFEFALTFNGYAACGSFEKCAEISNSDDTTTLSALRTRLFFNQRTAHHMSGWTSYEENNPTLSVLIELIRSKVAAGELE